MELIYLINRLSTDQLLLSLKQKKCPHCLLNMGFSKLSASFQKRHLHSSDLSCLTSTSLSCLSSNFSKTSLNFILSSGSLKPSLLFSTLYFQPTPKRDLILGRLSLVASHHMTLIMIYGYMPN